MSIVPGESVHPKFVSTAISSIQAFGEIVGAVFGVMIAGVLADSHGLAATLWLCAGCMAVATVIAFGYYETAPVVLARRGRSAGQVIGGQA